MPRPKRVVIVHSGDISMDPVLAGINEFRREGPDWHVRHQYQAPRNADEVAELLAFEPDGLIGVSASLAPAVMHRGFPWVSVRNRQSPLAVVLDDHAVGRCAAEHLIGLGAGALAVLPEGDTGWRRARREGFLAGLARHGRSAQQLIWDGPGGPRDLHRHLLAQIAALPKPLAIFAGNDWFALELMEALSSAGVRIPADVAVLGADDLPRCSEVPVPLSSVQVGHRECGRQAAMLLAEAMSNRSMAPITITVPPEGVAERASTDAIAVRDPEVASVLRFIRMRVAESFDVGDVIATSSLGRRSLEMRFRRLLGHTILDEIHRCRIAHAQSMLRNTETAIAEVATACGFSDPPHFTVVFRKVVGMTPSAWRAQTRGQVPG